MTDRDLWTERYATQTDQKSVAAVTILTRPESPSVADSESGNSHSREWAPPEPRTELRWAAVDLDGTIAEGVWTPDSNGREIGKPIARNIRKLIELRNAGYKIVIHTARGWEHYQSIESWLNHYAIPYDRIVCGKLLAAVYVDDRAIESERWTWHPSEQALRQEVGKMAWG